MLRLPDDRLARQLAELRRQVRVLAQDLDGAIARIDRLERTKVERHQAAADVGMLEEIRALAGQLLEHLGSGPKTRNWLRQHAGGHARRRLVDRALALLEETHYAERHVEYVPGHRVEVWSDPYERQEAADAFARQFEPTRPSFPVPVR